MGIDAKELFRTRKKRYTATEKKAVLREVVVLLRRGIVLGKQPAILGVPQSTLYLWVDRLRREGSDSLADKRQKPLMTPVIIEDCVQWCIENNYKPTPRGFRVAVQHLKLRGKRRPAALYEVYRRMIRDLRVQMEDFSGKSVAEHPSYCLSISDLEKQL